MMATKAKLTVVLKADSTVVAESDDANLWQRVLAAIQSGTAISEPVQKEKGIGDAAKFDLAVDDGDGDQAVNRFAKSLGLPSATVMGALSPSRDAPYLHLDHHCWSAMKKGTPKRGTGSISATGLAATLLALWIKEAKLDVQATQALASDVLNTINVKDPNASRGIKNTKWLHGRAGGVVVINAAEITKAVDTARSFCSKSWSAAGSSA